MLFLQIHEVAGKSETSTQVIRCGSGLDENRAVAHCSNCCCYLCETCWNTHKKQVFTRGHNTVSLEEIKQSDKPTGAKSLQKVQYCKDHEDEVLKLFCKTCKKVICRDCALVKHRDHDYTFIREIRPEVQQQLEALIKKVQAKEVEYKSHIDYLENVRGIGTNTLATCEREVNETFYRLQKAIESRRAALVAQLHDIHDSEKKQVDLEAEGLQLTLSKLSNSIGFTQQLLANGSDVEVVSMSVQAVQTLESLKTVNWNKNTTKPTLMRVKFDTEFEKHVNEFGTTSHEIQPEDLLVKLPKETANVGQEIKFEVHLSKEISERGYDATSELAVQLVHTTNNARIMCNLCKTNPNTWEASCIPKAEGEYEVTAVLGNVKAGSSILKVAQSHVIEQEQEAIEITGACSAYERPTSIISEEVYLPISPTELCWEPFTPFGLPQEVSHEVSPGVSPGVSHELPRHYERPNKTASRFELSSKGTCELIEAALSYEPQNMEALELPTSHASLCEEKHELSEVVLSCESSNMEVPKTASHSRHAYASIDALDRPSKSRTHLDHLTRQINTQSDQTKSKLKKDLRKAQKITQKRKKIPEWIEWGNI